MALSADRILETRNVRGICRGSGTVKTGSTIYKGAYVGRSSTGKIVACSNAGTSVRFVGVAEAGAVAGAVCNYLYNYEVLVPVKTGTTNGNTYKAIFAVDDQTVSTATTLGPCVGTLRELATTLTGWVAIGMTALTDNT